MPVVPTNFEADDLTMTITFAEGKTYEKKIGINFNVARKTIKGIKHTLGENTFEGEIDGETIEAWDGETTEAVAETDGVYVITKASQLAWVAEQVNGKANTFNGKKVQLGADIDLGGKDWNPIGQTGVAGFAGSFDGNGKTIFNLTIDNTDVTGQHGAAGLFGWVEQHSGSNSITNLTIDGVSIKSHRYSGAIAGWINIPVTNCTVKNVAIDCSYYDDDTDGTKVGALVGYADNGCSLTGNTVDTAVLNAYGDVGGLAGVGQASVSIDNNTLKNITVTYKSTAKSIAGEIVSTRVTPIIGTNNTVENVTIACLVTDTNALASAITAGVTNLYLADGTYQMPASAKGKILTISGTNNAIIEVVPGGQNEANGQLDYNLEGAKVIFNGVTIKTNSQLYAGYARLSGTYNKCVIQNTYNLGTGNSAFYDCTINITNEYLRVGGATTAIFDGCTFNTDGRAILVFQDGTSVAQTVTVKNCTFNATTSAYTWNNIHVAAVSYDGSQGGTYIVNFEGTNTVDSDFNGLWQIKNGESNVTVKGLE